MSLIEKEKEAVYSKNWNKFVSALLLYPNKYSLGMSNLGFQTIYQLLNQRHDVSCERAFSSYSTSLENRKRFTEFDVISISLSYELDIPDVLSTLHNANINILSSQRTEEDPLIIAGGAFPTINPDVLAPFIDIIVIGEGEYILKELFDHIHDWKAQPILKTDLYELLSAHPGIYIPELVKYEFAKSGEIIKIQSPKKITRSYISDLSSIQTYSPIVTPYSYFSNTFLVELNRGCPYNCRFCAVSKICQPFREYDFSDIWETIELGTKFTDKIGLVGSAIGDVSYLEELLKRLSEKNLQIGLSSLRADKLTPTIAEYLSSTGTRTITIAPEAGSERMRTRIKKQLDKDSILNAAGIVKQVNIPNIKLYFVVGFPDETEKDVEAIVSLSKAIRKISGANIHLSVNSFIPKPHTDFEREPMLQQKELKKKYEIIKDGLKKEKGFRLSFESVRLSVIQTLLSRGDRRLSDLLVLKSTSNLNWKQSIRQSKITLDHFVYKKFNSTEHLSWEIVNL